MKMSGKEAYSLILRGFPDIMNVEEMCTALSISTKTGNKLLKEGKINSIEKLIIILKNLLRNLLKNTLLKMI